MPPGQRGCQLRKGEGMARYGMAIDLTRCVGCQTCTVACQQVHNTRPGISWNVVEPVEFGREWPEADRCYLPHACMHCENAPCVAACPAGASVQRKDGVVIVDYEKCVACGLCVDACPYGARKMSTSDVWHFDAAEPAPYEAYGVQRVNVAEKCTFCAERLDEGLQPRCVDACFYGSRVFGDLDDPESAVSKFIAENDVIQVPGASVFYLCGKYDVDPVEYLVFRNGE